MKEKYIEYYMEELHEFFPEIPKEELEKMMVDISGRLTRYVTKGPQGFMVQTQQYVEGKRKRYKFQVDRVYGWDTLVYMRTKIRILKKLGLKKDRK
jgi:hypothetical protein